MRAVLKRLVSVIAYASLTATIIATPVLIENAVASAATCGSGATMNFVAHEDDDLLFQSPNLLREIKSGKCLRTVYALAGDAGENDSYWQDREDGVLAAYAQMMGVSNSWSGSDAGIAGHPISLFTLNGATQISLAFMHLPDGAIDGDGFPRNDYESLQKLYAQTMSEIYPVDGTPPYSLSGLTGTLLALMNAYQPNSINTRLHRDLR